MSHTPAEPCTGCQKLGRSDYPLLRDAADRPWHRHCYLFATGAHVAARDAPHCRGCGSIHPLADLTHDAREGTGGRRLCEHCDRLDRQGS